MHVKRARYALRDPFNFSIVSIVWSTEKREGRTTQSPILRLLALTGTFVITRNDYNDATVPSVAGLVTNGKLDPGHSTNVAKEYAK